MRRELPDNSTQPTGKGRRPQARRTVKRPLLANADAPFKARQIVSRAAVGLPRRLVERATLVASELVSNAVQYGSEASDHVWFGVSADGDEVTVTVDDHGAGAGFPDAGRDTHFGLQIMRQLADRWSIERNGSWKVSATFTAGPHPIG